MASGPERRVRIKKERTDGVVSRPHGPESFLPACRRKVSATDLSGQRIGTESQRLRVPLDP